MGHKNKHVFRLCYENFCCSNSGCVLDWPKSMDFLHANNSGDLEDCTSVDGHLRIIDATIIGLVYLFYLLLELKL